MATARLPIKKFIQLDSRAVLTINHVVQIMVEMINRWEGQHVPGTVHLPCPPAHACLACHSPSCSAAPLQARLEGGAG